MTLAEYRHGRVRVAVYKYVGMCDKVSLHFYVCGLIGFDISILGNGVSVQWDLHPWRGHGSATKAP